MAVKTWADGFGVWHVRVSTTTVAPLMAVRQALRDELTARESASAPVAPHIWRQPIRLPDLDTEGTMVYREFTPEALSEPERFFYEHAGTYYYDRDTETAEDGRIRGARDLAAAEARLKAGPYYVDHTPDDEPWDGDVPYDGPLWNVYLYSVEGTASATLLGSRGPVACEADDPRIRVVAAELALRYLPPED